MTDTPPGDEPRDRAPTDASLYALEKLAQAVDEQGHCRPAGGARPPQRNRLGAGRRDALCGDRRGRPDSCGHKGSRATGINNAAAHLEMETSPEMDFLSADSRQHGPVQAKHAYVEAGAPLENKLRHYLTHDAAELETMT